MSTLQVANIYFDATGINKIVYESNTIVFSTNGQEVIGTTRIDNLITFVENAFNDTTNVSEYKITYVNTAPVGYIEVVNTAYNNADYPALATILNSDPYLDVANTSTSYDTNTQFKTPPFYSGATAYFSPKTVDGNRIYIYMKT
jgi:hypothetical protein